MSPSGRGSSAKIGIGAKSGRLRLVLAAFIAFVTGPFVVVAIFFVPLIVISAIVWIIQPGWLLLISIFMTAALNEIIFKTYVQNLIFSLVLLPVLHLVLSKYPIVRDLLMPFVGAGLAIALFWISDHDEVQAALAGFGGLVAAHVFCLFLREGAP